MDITFALDQFNKKLVVPLTEDIKRTLEVTCCVSGPDNHGSNFVGNSLVLMGVETISQFINSTSGTEDLYFRLEAKREYKKLNKKERGLLAPRHSKIDGSKLARKFMKTYFEDFFLEKKEFGVSLEELIWEFRNSHMHSFYPYYKSNFNGIQVCGAVDWAFKNTDEKIGIKISEIERNFDDYKNSLYRVDGCYFRVCPQILFVFFKRAIAKYENKVHCSEDVGRKFMQNYKKLSEAYSFDLKIA